MPTQQEKEKMIKEAVDEAFINWMNETPDLVKQLYHDKDKSFQKNSNNLANKEFEQVNHLMRLTAEAMFKRLTMDFK